MVMLATISEFRSAVVIPLNSAKNVSEPMSKGGNSGFGKALTASGAESVLISRK